MSGNTEMITPGGIQRPIISPAAGHGQILLSESTQQIGVHNGAHTAQLNKGLPIISLNQDTETSEEVEQSSFMFNTTE